MNTLAEIIQEMQGTGTAVGLAARLGLSPAALSRIKRATRQQAPADGTVAKLLRVAEPEQAAAILKVLGIEDVEQFATALLAAAGVPPVAVEGTVGKKEEKE